MKSVRPIILDEFVIVISKLEEVNKNMPFSVFSSSFRTYIIEQKFNIIPFQTLGKFDKSYSILKTDRIIRLISNRLSVNEIRKV